MSNGSPKTVIGPLDVLAFWRAAGPDKWFSKDTAFDTEIAVRSFLLYAPPPRAACRAGSASRKPRSRSSSCSISSRATCSAATREAFATDPLARAVADRAIARGFDQQVPQGERQFFYLPFMHSEDVADQERCIALSRAAGDEQSRELRRTARRHHPALRPLSASQCDPRPHHHAARNRRSSTPAASG